jgi:anti-sigma factor RsiW
MGHELDRIQGLLDGELAPHEAAEVRDHCARCRECGQALVSAVAVWQRLDAAAAPPPPRAAWPGVQAALAARTHSGALTPRLAASAVAAALGGLALGLTLGLGGFTSSRGDGQTPESAPEVAAATDLVVDGVSLLVDESAPTLERLYFSDAADLPQPVAPDQEATP